MSEIDANPPEEQRLGHLLWGILARPRATLETLNEHGGRTWWLPVLLGVLLTISPVVAQAPIQARQIREAVPVSAGQFGGQQEAELSPEEQEQLEQAQSIVASPLITVVFPAVAAALGRAVGWLIWAGALYLASTALGGRSTFGQMLRTVVWVWLPYAVRGLLQTIYVLASGQIIANPGLSGFVLDSRGASDPTTFIRPSSGQILLASLLERVDIYLFWHLALLVAGVMVASRLPRRKALVVTLGMWVLFTLIGLIPPLIGVLLAGQFVGG